MCYCSNSLVLAHHLQARQGRNDRKHQTPNPRLVMRSIQYPRWGTCESRCTFKLSFAISVWRIALHRKTIDKRLGCGECGFWRRPDRSKLIPFWYRQLTQKEADKRIWMGSMSHTINTTASTLCCVFIPSMGPCFASRSVPLFVPISSRYDLNRIKQNAPLDWHAPLSDWILPYYINGELAPFCSHSTNAALIL